ncbi:hypothetical protein LMG96_001231 [Escherichia coli]|nr:hypothetical protein [Escherichia coli]
MNKSTLICEARPTVLIICFPVSSLISISHFEYFSLGYASAKTSLMRSLMSSSVRLQPEFSKQRNMTSDLVMCNSFDVAGALKDTTEPDVVKRQARSLTISKVGTAHETCLDPYA